MTLYDETTIKRLEAMIESDHLDDAVVGYVYASPWATWVELVNFFKSRTEVEGKMVVTVPSYPTIWLWANLSDSFIDAVGKALKEKRIEMEPTEWLTYMIDDGTLQIPLAKRLHHYKKKRWLPVCFIPTEKERRRQGGRPMKGISITRTGYDPKKGRQTRDPTLEAKIKRPRLLKDWIGLKARLIHSLESGDGRMLPIGELVEITGAYRGLRVRVVKVCQHCGRGNGWSIAQVPVAWLEPLPADTEIDHWEPRESGEAKG